MKNYEFVELCKNGKPAEIRAAIKAGADPNARIEFDRTALMTACNNNTSEAVKILLDAGADPNAADCEGWTALMSVVDKDEAPIETVKYLLDAGANVNAKNEFDTTPLLRAVCWNNRPDIVNLLLDSGADMFAYGAVGFDYFEYGGDTPAEASIGRLETLKIFIDRGVDVNRRYGGGNTLLIEAANMWRSFEAVKFLIEQGADVNAMNDNNLTALIAVAKRGGSDDAERTVNILLDNGADPNVRHDGLYALDYARRNRSLTGTETLQRLEKITDIAEISEKISPKEFAQLLEHGSIERVAEAIKASADIRRAPDDAFGEAPIFYTIRRRPEIELIKLLLDAGIDINEPGDENSWHAGDTLLMTALTRPQNQYFRESSYEMIKFLIDRGADVNAKTPTGATVLMRAAANRDGDAVDVVKLLLDHGADVNAKSDDGSTALMSAASRGYHELCELLLDAGADINAKQVNGRTALIEVLNNLGCTSVMKDIKLVKMLLSRGAEINIKAKDEGIWTCGDGDCYRTPLMMAANNSKTFYDTTESGYWGEVDPLPSLIRTLLDAGANVNETDTNGDTALMLAVKVREPHPEVIAMLLDAGADVNVERDGLRAVDFARRNKNLVDTEIYHRLKSLTRPSTTKRHVGAAEMLYLINNDLEDELKRVIADGADVNERDGGWTLLMSAARDDEPNLNIVKILLDAGADVNAVDDFGETALKKAVYARYSPENLELIEMLIVAGADPNIANDDGETPLMYAARYRNPDVVKELRG